MQFLLASLSDRSYRFDGVNGPCRIRVPMVPVRNQVVWSMSCLPTAPALPAGASGEFGTSAFRAALDKPPLAYTPTMGPPVTEHKTISCFNVGVPRMSF